MLVLHCTTYCQLLYHKCYRQRKRSWKPFETVTDLTELIVPLPATIASTNIPRDLPKKAAVKIPKDQESKPIFSSVFGGPLHPLKRNCYLRKI